MSTRKNGFVSELYPLLKDFNYIIVKVIINGKSYFLDATSKHRPFGELPLKVINSQVRILDYNNTSFWETLKPLNGIKNIRIQGEIVDDNFNGFMAISRTGFEAEKTRERFSTIEESNYLNELENINTKLIIEDYKNYNLKKLENIFREKMAIRVELNVENNKVLRFNPFLIDKILTNPFQEKFREYPLDFGRKKKFNL